MADEGTTQSARGGATAPAEPDERAGARAERRRERAAARRRWRARQREKQAARPAAPPLAPAPESSGRRRVRQGVVVSSKAAKTITVRIDVVGRHRAYQKTVRSSSTIHAHDERGEAREGDTVRVVESRPLSRTKRWRLIEILERAR